MSAVRRLIAVGCLLLLVVQGCASSGRVLPDASAFDADRGAPSGGVVSVRAVDGVQVAKWIALPFALFGAFWADLFIMCAFYWPAHRSYDFDCMRAVVHWARR